VNVTIAVLCPVRWVVPSASVVMWKTSCSSSMIVPIAPVQVLVSPGLTSICRWRTVIVSALSPLVRLRAAGGP
jgi:hypothetical protein